MPDDRNKLDSHRDNSQKYRPKHAAFIIFARLRGCGADVAYGLIGVVGGEGACVVGVVDHAGGDGQDLAFGERRAAGQAITAGQFVPQGRVAP